MTTRDDLVSRLREQPPVMSIKHSSDCAVNDHTFPEDTADWSDCNCFATRKYDIDLFNEAISAFEAKDAEIARLTERQERMWCQACGTVTRTGVCDCNRHDDREPSFVNYADKLQTDCQESISRISDLERQLAEETERCAAVADSFADRYDATAFISDVTEQVSALRSKEQAAHDISAAIRGCAK